MADTLRMIPAILAALAFGGLGLGAGSAGAGEVLAVDNQETFTGKRVTLDVQKADLRWVLMIIGRASGKNLVLPDSLQGRVTVKLQDVPWDQALDLVLRMKGLGVEESGNVLMVYPLDSLPRNR